MQSRFLSVVRVRPTLAQELVNQAGLPPLAHTNLRTQTGVRGSFQADTGVCLHEEVASSTQMPSMFPGLVLWFVFPLSITLVQREENEILKHTATLSTACL